MRALTAVLLAAAMILAVGAVPMTGLLANVFAAEPTPYIVVDDCDTTAYFDNCSQDVNSFKQGKASVRTSAKGTTTVTNTSSFNVALTEDILNDWYLEMWLYIDNTSRLTLNKSSVVVYQSSTIKGEYKFSKLTLKNGWNRVQIKLSAMAYTNKAQFTTLNRVQLILEATSNVIVQLDDICLIGGTAAEDLSKLEAAVQAGDALAATNLSGYAKENVDIFKAALESAKGFLTGHSQRDVDVATAVLKNSMNAFGMEGFEDDGEALLAYIDFDTGKYSRIDRYAIMNADGSQGAVQEIGGKKAAAFNGSLLVAVNDEYISASDAIIRINYSYYNGEKGTLALKYNAADNAEKDGGSVTLQNTGMWARKSAKFTDAKLNEGINGSYDLEIALSGADLGYVSRVEIKLVTETDVTEKEVPKFAPMTDVNNFEGKSVAGYQMWFTASSGSGGWVHWAGGNIPSNDRISFEMWPDTSEYPQSVLENTAFKNLGDGRPAQLFTSVRQETVDLHVSWMQEAGLDGFAIQRFYGTYTSPNAADNLKLAAAAAEKYDRLFYVMYDLNGALGTGNRAAEVLKSDWVRNVEQTGVISSTSYAQRDGKPVVCMWGLDPGSDSYANHDASMEFICWLQDRGYYVMGGTSNNTWYDNTNSFTDVYRQLDLISPWTVGRYNYNGVTGWMKSNYTPALQVCEKYDIDFQPVIIAGSGWHNHNWGMPNDQPRNAGNFLWRQAYLVKNQYHLSQVYFAMFDEYDEATAIMKAAQDSYDIPEDEQYFTTLATDGYWLSSDFYLRLAGEICSLMRDPDAVLDVNHTVPFSEGPVYWRNSFEKRWTYVRKEDKEAPNGRTTIGVSLQSLDVCQPFKPTSLMVDATEGTSVIQKTYECSDYVEYVQGNTDYKKYGTNTVGTGLHCDPTKTRTTNGTWSLQFNGKSGGDNASLTYRLASANIMVSAAGLELTYDVYADNDLGQYVYMDLVLEVDGKTKMLSDYVKETKTSGAKKGQWVSVKVTLPASLVGQKITHVVVGYAHSGTGEFNAYLDNVILQSPGNKKTMLQTAVKTAGTLSANEQLTAAIEAGNGVLNSSASTDKQRMNAVKDIDRAIRSLDVKPDGLWGDVDRDGKITTTDARLTLQFSAKKIGEDALDTAAADVDGDKKISTTDARLILQRAAKKIDFFPVEA